MFPTRKLRVKNTADMIKSREGREKQKDSYSLDICIASLHQSTGAVEYINRFSAEG